MKGHIVQRAKDSWSIVIDKGIVSGKRKQQWTTVRGSKKDAQMELRRLLTALDEGTFVENSKMTVSEYLNYWLENHAKQSVSGKTFERYEEIIQKHLNPVFPVLLQKFRPVEIQSYFTTAEKSGRKDGKGGLSRQTLKHHYRLLKGALKQAIPLGLIKVNPMEAVTCPKVSKKEMRVIDVDGVLELLEQSKKSKIYISVLIASQTGMRRGEICALRWKDVDLVNGQVSVSRTLEQTKEKFTFKEPKTENSSRTVALGELLITALKTHKAEQAKIRLMMGKGYQDNDLIVCNPDGSLYPPDTLTSTYRSMVQGTKFQGLRFHDLRHSHATIHLALGTAAKIVQERLGHSTISTTMDLYSHVVPGMQESAVAKMEEAFKAAKDKR